MGSDDLVNILGIVINLVSNDRAIDQESAEVRNFKMSASNLIAHLSVTSPGTDAEVDSQQTLKQL